MSKINKIILILIITITCITVPNFANAASELEKFVSSSDFSSVTSVPTDELNKVQQGTLDMNIATYLNQAQTMNESNKPEEAKKYLEDTYNTLIKEDYASTPKTCKYIGYRLGTAWKLYNQAVTESKNNDAAKQFDKIYKEYQTADKSDNTKLTDIKNRLEAQYNRLTKEEKKQSDRENKRKEVYNKSVETDTTINQKYTSSTSQQSTGQLGELGESTAESQHTVNEIITEAQGFINKGKKTDKTTLNGWNIRSGSNTIYNILLSVGIVIATAVGAYLGLKFIMSSAEDKAQVKEALIPYVAGCIVIFGAFIIWKLAINLLGSLDKVAKNSYNIEYSIAQQIEINDDFNIFS